MKFVFNQLKNVIIFQNAIPFAIGSAVISIVLNHIIGIENFQRFFFKKKLHWFWWPSHSSCRHSIQENNLYEYGIAFVFKVQSIYKRYVLGARCACGTIGVGPMHKLNP